MNFDFRIITVNTHIHTYAGVHRMNKNREWGEKTNGRKNKTKKISKTKHWIYTIIKSIISNHQHFIVCTCKIYWPAYLVHCPKWAGYKRLIGFIYSKRGKKEENCTKKNETKPLFRFITLTICVLHFGHNILFHILISQFSFLFLFRPKCRTRANYYENTNYICSVIRNKTWAIHFHAKSSTLHLD